MFGLIGNIQINQLVFLTKVAAISSGEQALQTDFSAPELTGESQVQENYEKQFQDIVNLVVTYKELLRKDAGDFASLCNAVAQADHDLSAQYQGG